MQPTYSPQPINHVYLGPQIEVSSFRAKNSLYSENLAPAYVPDPLIYKVENYRSMPVDDLMLRPPVTNELLISLEEHIKNHFEGRIADFWKDILLIYRTGLLFRLCESADSQIGGPGSSSFVPKTEEQCSKGFAAAHMSTLPALQLQIANEIHQCIAFGRGSFFHKHANATTWLPVVVNRVDSSLDKTKKITAYTNYPEAGFNATFRYVATGILNDLSQNLFTPHQALYWFLIKSLEYLQHIKTDDIHKIYVINCYCQVAESYLKKMGESDGLLRALCGMPRDRSSIEEVYLKVQGQMHRQFAYEMEALKPVIIFDPFLESQLATSLNPKRFQAFIESFLKSKTENQSLATTPKVYTYVNNESLKDPNVRTVALKYLVGVPDAGVLESNLNQAMEARTPKTIKKVGLPPPLLEVYRKIIEVLASKNINNPQHMNSILIRVLAAMCSNPKI